MRDLILFISFLFLISCDSTNKKDVVSDYNSVNQDANTAKAIISVYKKNILLGKYNYKTDSSFVKIPKSLSNKTIYINILALQYIYEYIYWLSNASKPFSEAQPADFLGRLSWPRRLPPGPRKSSEKDCGCASRS